MTLTNQFKYAFKHSAVTRYTTFLGVFAINLVFGLLAYFGVLGFAATITAVSLSGTGLAAVIIANIIADISSLNSILGSPSGYTYALVPEKSGKILFARITAIVVQDFFTMAINILGVVWLSTYLAGWSGEFGSVTINFVFDFFKIVFYSFSYYAFIYMFIIFCVVFKNSILFSVRGRGFFIIPCGAIVFWVLSLIDFALIPFSVVDHWFLFYNLTIYNTVGIVIHMALTLLKILALFFVTSKLMDRRMNY